MLSLDANGARYLELLKQVLTDYLRISMVESSSSQTEGLTSLAERQRARKEGRDWPLQGETMIGLDRLNQLQSALLSVVAEGVPGDFIETGVWRGGACIFARAVFAALGVSDRRVWVADSFAGLPPPRPERYPADRGDDHHTQEALRVARSSVERNFAKFGLLDQQVCFLEGWFQETLPTAPINAIAVLRLDGDMYESTMAALEALYDRVSPGGYVIVDDYGAVDGCRAAVDEFRARRKIDAPLSFVDWTGAGWRVPRRQTMEPSLSYELAPAEGARWDLWTGYANPTAGELATAAEVAYVAGDHAQAEALALSALEQDSNALPAHALLSRLRLPGPDYLATLAEIHARKRPSVYVEIGVARGESLRLAPESCLAIGVDPCPWPDFNAGTMRLELVRQTSRDFFATGTAARLLHGTGFDFAFIDGCHRFEEVLADFAQLEQYAAPGAVIAMHDMQPLDETTSLPLRRTTFYSGDGWKVLAVLRDVRPELRIRTVAAAPTGLTLVDNLQPASTVLRRRLTELAGRYAALDWQDYQREREQLLHSIPNRVEALDYLGAR